MGLAEVCPASDRRDEQNSGRKHDPLRRCGSATASTELLAGTDR
jgi:hypothetical protein